MICFRTGRLAALIGVHRNTVGNWIKSGALRARHAVGKQYAVDKEFLIRFLQSKGVDPETAWEVAGEFKECARKSSRWKGDAALQTHNSKEEVPMSDNKVGSVMIAGGGIAGIQSALDLADSGYFVYLLEKSPGIGGGMAQLDKTFPTNDCAM